MKKTDKYGVWEIRRDEGCLNKQNIAPTELYNEAQRNKPKDELLKDAEKADTVKKLKEIVIELIKRS